MVRAVDKADTMLTLSSAL